VKVKTVHLQRKMGKNLKTINPPKKMALFHELRRNQSDATLNSRLHLLPFFDPLPPLPRNVLDHLAPKLLRRHDLSNDEGKIP